MTNPNFTASISTNELYRDLDTTVCLTDLLDGYDSSLSELESVIDDITNAGYASVNHVHDEYALATSLDALTAVVSGKADSSHTHDYAPSAHDHNDTYYTESEVDSQISVLNTAISGKSDSSHTHTPESIGAAASTHTHNYLPLTGGTITGSTIINNATDVGAGFSGGEPLIVGDPTGLHIAFDNNEIQGKSNATTAGNITINYDGGDVGLGGGTGKVISRVPMYFPNETVVYGTDTDGTQMSVFTASSFNDNTAVGYDRYHYNDEGKGNLNLYGKDIRLWSREAGLAGHPLGVNRVLWTGGYLMTADHTAELAFNISAQVSGIVLIWSCYSNNTVQNFGYATHFIPKYFALMHGGSGMDFPLMRQSAGKVGSKYLYIHDNKIVGHANNNASGANNGITYDNGYWVLRAVIGV